ncbi:MAG: FixH family protein [Balneolaceae bacterium]
MVPIPGVTQKLLRQPVYGVLSCTVILLLAISVAITGCQVSNEDSSGIQVQWELDPDPPVTGMSTLHIALSDSTGEAVTGAEIELEGNMSHPGMQPVLSTAEEVASGEYEARFEFTMAGDWFILLQMKLPDEMVIERQIDISGVRTQ